jgi:aspartyl-tRNA(Asn)/glutamyl-tRNA(Gln) amidotransferase subunit A
MQDMVGPVRRRLERVDARALQPWEPAVAFDPLRAAGERPPQLRPGPTPAVGPGPLAAAARRLRRRELSARELTESVLARIGDDPLRAYITLDPAGARAAADRADAELGAGCDRGPLHGIPVAVKDIIATAGLRTTAGSRLLADHVPARDAAVVRRLRAAGAVIVGKANTHEFAAGPTGENPHFGSARNPWHTGRVAGGSSSGSAVAVAAGLALAALGTDTGGSVRIPAHCCGVVGLKPTYGRVSRAGVFPLAWSLDHVGPLGASVGDVAALLGAVAGFDPEDPTTADLPVPDFAARLGERDLARLTGVRIGVPEAWLDGRVQPGVRAAFTAALQVLAALGTELRAVELPAPDDLAPLNRAIAFAEGTAYHWADVQERPELYGADVLARKRAGAEVSAVAYLQAQRLRAEFCRRVAALWATVDALATPTLPCVAPPPGTALGYGADMIRFTAFVNLLGLPAVSVPCGFAGPDGGAAAGPGLPVGLQLVGRAFREADLLRLAAAYEAARGPWPQPDGAA